MKQYIILIIFILHTFSSCTTRRGVHEGDWIGKMVDQSTGIEMIVPMNINESKVYWDVKIIDNDTIIQLDAEQIKDSLFLLSPYNQSEFRLKIESKSHLNGIWTNGSQIWDFEATYKAD